MIHYIARKTRLAKILMGVLSVSACLIQSCTDDTDKASVEHNFSLEFSTRAGEKTPDLVPHMRLFTSYSGAPNDNIFYQEVLNVTRSANKLSASIEAGTWNLTLVSSNTDVPLIAPAGNVGMQNLPMYKYQPTVTGGKSSDAPEIFFQNKKTPLISQNVMNTMNVQLDRTVAKVELIVRRTTSNFKKTGSHRILLHNIPSTVTYNGGLYPNPVRPDTLPAPLQAPIQLESTSNGYLKGTQTIEFIIPAHQGADFLNDTPVDTTKQKMNVTVELERLNGGRFVKQAVIPYVAKCNKILRVYIDVNDGVMFKTEFLPWERVAVDAELGQGYRNWLYVKKGETGNGLSWSDPLPDINTAIDKAKTLMAKKKTVHGILVAGGPSLVYDEAFDIPANIKIYGGWEGVPNTELDPNDPKAPHTSTDRKLQTCKAHINAGTGNIWLLNEQAVLDGFILSGTGKENTAALLTVWASTAWINAIEIKNQTLKASSALVLSNGMGTNILVSDNSAGISVTGRAKLINATIVNNQAASLFNATVLNTIYWGNAGAVTASGTIMHSAFQEPVPAGTSMSDIYPLHATDNTAWFTEDNTVPGPHFNTTETPDAPKYFAGTNQPDRAPMLGRGDQISFDGYTTAIPATAKKDINGQPRHHEGTDIGCFEDSKNPGFKLEWNMTALYISPKKNIESEHPVILFKNMVGAHVKWEATIVQASQYTMDQTTASGEGNTEYMGMFKLTTTAVNSSNTPYERGLIRMSGNVGVYLPSKELKVYQTPGVSRVWDEGYVGSFHRWNETKERCIQGSNGGNWTAQIIRGVDWIKLDTNPRGYNNGDVVETPGGSVSGTGDIIFRVGVKSQLASLTTPPRYGLIIIHRSGGIALFFVRQGEQPDYLYRKTDERNVNSSDKGRDLAEKVSPYNLTDPQGRTASTDLGRYGGDFVHYPSQNGYFFQWNRTMSYYPIGIIKHVPPTTNETYWNDIRDACPRGYHTPREPQFVQSIYRNKAVGAIGQDNSTFVYGRLADGFFDKYAKKGEKQITAASTNHLISDKQAASYGLLIYNETNNASVFFPIAGYRESNNSRIVYNDHAWYWMATPRNTFTEAWHTHWTTNHIGMSCTVMERRDAGNVRCFKDNN
ncbi:MAG: hypothetical protein LBU44_04660 [Mediterranea sp.]|nr:hypothetical protein [Mediterranea sp.]